MLKKDLLRDVFAKEEERTTDDRALETSTTETRTSVEPAAPPPRHCTDSAQGSVVTPSPAQSGTLGLLGLRDLLLNAVAVIEAWAETEPAVAAPAPIPIANIAAAKGRYVASDWPRLLPRGVEAEGSRLFDDPRYHELYRPGESIEIHVGAGAGLQRLSRNLLAPAYKVGTVKANGVLQRFKNLKAERYGAYWHNDGTYVQDPDFDDMFPSIITSTLKLSSNSPARMTPRSIVVTLPLEMSALDFEMALRAEIGHCALHRWLMTDEGIRHCTVLKVDPAIGQRSTGYKWGAALRMSPAEEIYTIRPSRDGDALAIVAERIVLRSLGLLADGPAQ